MKAKKIQTLLSAMLLLTSLSIANECKIKVDYAKNALDNTLRGNVQYVIHHASTLTTSKKHMRKVTNHGNHDVKISYWSATGNHTKIIKKGKKAWVSGDLKETKCLKTPTHAYRLDCAAGNSMTVQYNRSTERARGIKNRLLVTFKAAKKGTKYGRLNHGECSWVDRAFKANEPKKFCQYNVYDLAFTKNSNGYALRSKKAPYVDKLRTGGKFSLMVTKKNGCMVVKKVLK